MADIVKDLSDEEEYLVGRGINYSASVIRDAIAEIERLRKANVEPDVGKRDQWLPIETAPKDGSLVDLWAYWPEHDRWRREAGCGWVDGDWHNGTWAFHQYEQPPTATHWMPLPKPPTDDLIVGSDVGSTAPAE